ncbi:MAG: RsiV family protein [Prevotellaceae bacterium]|jgi:hypothetical protein|nr:RsiV family protein [Prevotellaceae bacterium]
MKQIVYSIALAVIFTACCKKKDITENDITFETFIANETCPINPQDTVGGGCVIDITMVYPVAFADSAALGNIQQEIVGLMFGDEYFRSNPQEIINGYMEFEKENWQFTHNNFATALNRAKRDVLLNFNVTLHSEVRFNKGGVLAYLISKSMYEGGAHSLTGSNFLFFDLATGSRIIEDDIFEDNYNEMLAAIFARSLQESLGSDTDNVLADNDFENIFPNGNFYADEEGITYLFHQDEIAFADLSGDEIEIFIPYKDIKSILKRNSPIAVFF